MTAASTFADAIRARLGAAPAGILADGRIHWSSTKPTSRDDAGWNVFGVDTPAGSFGCRIYETWLPRVAWSMAAFELSSFIGWKAPAKRRPFSVASEMSASLSPELASILACRDAYSRLAPTSRRARLLFIQDGRRS